MKNAAVKKISAVILTVFMFFAFASNAFAETIQDRLEQQLNDLANQYESADPETQKSLQERFSELLVGAGLDNIDLGSLAGADIGSIISGAGDNLALGSVMGLVTDAFSSGMDMIQDAIGGGLGTSDGSNTATTIPSTTGSPIVIVPVEKPEETANAESTSSTAESTTTTVPSTAITNISANIPSMPVTNAPVTYAPVSTTVANLVGAGVTTAPQVDLDGVTDSGTSSIAVFVVLSVSTLAIITAIVVFFIIRRK